MIIVNIKAEYSSTPNNYVTLLAEWEGRFLCVPIMTDIMEERCLSLSHGEK